MTHIVIKALIIVYIEHSMNIVASVWLYIIMIVYVYCLARVTSFNDLNTLEWLTWHFLGNKLICLLFFLVSLCISSYVKAFLPTYYYCYVLHHCNHFNQILVLFRGTYNLQGELFNRFLTFHPVYPTIQ